MKPVLSLLRKSQWRWDFAVASHGASFHAPQEVIRILVAQSRFRITGSTEDFKDFGSSRFLW
jgi:formate-dependent nitrite reductase cytochrome c552 subunit